jgi:hypothetical protein
LGTRDCENKVLMKLLATSVHTMAFPEIALMNWLFSRVETGHEE